MTGEGYSSFSANTAIESNVNEINRKIRNMPTILLRENSLIINGNGMPLNTAEINSIISKNNAHDLDTVISSAPGTVIEDQIFENTTLTMDSSDNSIIRNNVFKNHYADGLFQGRDMVYVSSSTNITIENNVFNNITNKYTNGFDLMGIYLETTQDVTITGNTFTNFWANGNHHTAIYCLETSFTTVKDNTIMNNNATRNIRGIWFEGGGNNKAIGNKVSNIYTTSTLARAYGFDVYADNNNLYENNEISNIFANESKAFGYYFFDVSESKIIQISDYQATLPVLPNGAKFIDYNYTDVHLRNTNNTGIELLNDMNITIVDSGSYNHFNYTINNVIQTEGTWQNNVTVFDIIPTTTVDQHVYIFNGTTPKVYMMNTTGYTEAFPPVIDTASVPAGTIEIVEGDSLDLMWTVSDDFAGTYDIFIDAVSVVNGNWESGVSVSYQVFGLTVGTHELSAQFSDIFGNDVIYILTITVTALPVSTTEPTTTTTPPTSTTPPSSTSTPPSSNDEDQKTSDDGFLDFPFTNIVVIGLLMSMLGMIQIRKRK